MTTYTVIKDLGHGAFGQVRHCNTDTWGDVAVKIFDPAPIVRNAIANGAITEDELKKRFFSEATYQAKIQHPNVVHVYHSDLSTNPPFFVMELAEDSLDKDLLIDHTLGGNPQNALFEILAGLEWIHSQGLYHRDLKPQNILRFKNSDGSPRYAISDFGLIKITTGDATTLTVTGAQGGTERYAAPEFISNFKRSTARSDIFSFGVILFDIFVGPNTPRIPYTEVDFPGLVGSVAAKCTKTLPARRYATVSEVRSALYDALQTGVPQFNSVRDEQIFELLNSEDKLTDKQWDNVFLLLDDTDPNSQTYALLLRAFTKNHLLDLRSDSPDLLYAFAGTYIDYVNEGRGHFDFDYCDVIADKLTWLFEIGDISIRAQALLAMLGLGTSHNRWFVERRFMNLAGPSLDTPTAERVIMEVEVRGLNLIPDIQHLESSINISRSQLSPFLQRLW